MMTVGFYFTTVRLMMPAICRAEALNSAIVLYRLLALAHDIFEQAIARVSQRTYSERYQAHNTPCAADTAEYISTAADTKAAQAQTAQVNVLQVHQIRIHNLSFYSANEAKNPRQKQP